MKKHDFQMISTLIKLTVDVYNDSMIKTLSPWSWPSRSLAHQHAENLVAHFTDHGLDYNFMPFSPGEGSLQYKNPIMYSEMLEIVASLETEKLVEKLKEEEASWPDYRRRGWKYWIKTWSVEKT